MAASLRATLVTAHWGDPRDERQLVTRLVAGALSTRARVTVIHLADESDPSAHWDGAFEVRRLRATNGRPLMQATLLAALSVPGNARPLPGVAGWDLLALEGGGADELGGAIGESEPDVLVIGGVMSWPPVWSMSPAGRPRRAVWPLLGDDSRLELPGYRDFLAHADVVCTLSDAEHHRVFEPQALAGAPPVESMPVPLLVDRLAARSRLPGLSRLDGYVLFLRDFPPGSPERSEIPDYRRLRQLVPGLAVADVSHEGWRVFGDGFDVAVPGAPSRMNLWRLMSHALATVDLRRGGIIGREVIESLLLGTPVAVPDTSWSTEPVSQSGGGVVFSGQSELVAALRTFADAPARARLAEQGRCWAEDRHGDQERFTATVIRTVLDLPYP